MQYPISQIATIMSGTFLNDPIGEGLVEHLLLDSRQVVFPKSSLFIALNGRRFDGHEFLNELYKYGIRNFLVSKKSAPKNFHLPISFLLKTHMKLCTNWQVGIEVNFNYLLLA